MVIIEERNERHQCGIHIVDHWPDHSRSDAACVPLPIAIFGSDNVWLFLAMLASDWISTMDHSPRICTNRTHNYYTMERIRQWLAIHVLLTCGHKLTHSRSCTIIAVRFSVFRTLPMYSDTENFVTGSCVYTAVHNSLCNSPSALVNINFLVLTLAFRRDVRMIWSRDVQSLTSM